MGANDSQTLRALVESEAYDGPSLVICYCHCIAHGIDMTQGLRSQNLAVDSGQWLMYRYNPALLAEGKNPLKLDSRKPKIPVSEYLMNENRFMMLTKSNPEAAKQLFQEAQADVDERWLRYSFLASREYETAQV